MTGLVGQLEYECINLSALGPIFKAFKYKQWLFLKCFFDQFTFTDTPPSINHTDYRLLPGRRL
jgi:hypothetical protein